MGEREFEDTHDGQRSLQIDPAILTVASALGNEEVT